MAERVLAGWWLVEGAPEGWRGGEETGGDHHLAGQPRRTGEHRRLARGRRLARHYGGCGSSWTRLDPPRAALSPQCRCPQGGDRRVLLGQGGLGARRRQRSIRRKGGQVGRGIPGRGGRWVGRGWPGPLAPWAPGWSGRTALDFARWPTGLWGEGRCLQGLGEGEGFRGGCWWRRGRRRRWRSAWGGSRAERGPAVHVDLVQGGAPLPRTQAAAAAGAEPAHRLPACLASLWSGWPRCHPEQLQPVQAVSRH